MLSHKSSAAPSYGGGSSEGPDHRQLGSGPPSFPATALHECNRGILAGRPARLNDAYAALFDGLCDGLTDWVQSGAPTISKQRAAAIPSVGVASLLRKGARAHSSARSKRTCPTKSTSRNELG